MISINKLPDNFKSRPQTTAILLTILTLIFISAANRQIFAQECSNVTFSQSFINNIFSGGSASVVAGLAATDFNRDANQDFAVTQFETDTIFIFFGDGKGKFTRTSFVTVDSPRFLRTADFNRDAKPDLIIFSADRTVVYLGDGSGNFNIGQTLLNVSNAALLDFNDDGKLDLLNTIGTATLKVFNGGGDGTFANAVDVALPVGIANPASGDFNRDGKTDLIALTNPGIHNLVFLPGSGAGGFGAATTFTAANIGVGTLNRIVNAGDLNADGKPDLIVIGDNQTNAARILLGAESGVFTLSSFLPVNGTVIDDIRTADFNQDGKLDLAILGFGV